MTDAEIQLVLKLNALDLALFRLSEAERAVVAIGNMDNSVAAVRLAATRVGSAKKILLDNADDGDPRYCPSCDDRLTDRTHVEFGRDKIPTYCDSCDSEVL